MKPSNCSLAEIQRWMDEVKRFLSITLSIANAHTVEFYTHDVWERFVAVSPAEVLMAVSSGGDQQGETQHQKTACSGPTFGFCPDSNRLVDIHDLLAAAKAHSLPSLGVCLSRDELLQILRGHRPDSEDVDSQLNPKEFMNSKKSHEVQCMSDVVCCLAQHCGVKQVIDVGSGKGYLSSFLSLHYGLRVFGIDSSSINTHGAHERNRKLKKFSRAYQKRIKKGGTREETSISTQVEMLKQDQSGPHEEEESMSVVKTTEQPQSEVVSGPEELFLSALSADVIQSSPRRVPPSQLGAEERERRKRENLERKAQSRQDADSVFSPLTSYITAETELRELITELQDAVIVGLHTCGDLAASTLRMFTAKPELAAVCSVGCCYHLLSEEFDPASHVDAHYNKVNEGHIDWWQEGGELTPYAQGARLRQSMEAISREQTEPRASPESAV